MGNSSSSSSSGGGSSYSYSCRALRLYDADSARQARVHDRSDFSDPESLVNHLQPGDMVQKKGNWLHQWFYSHFAVYIGNGDVVHIVGSGPARRGALVDEFRGELVRKNNTHDDVLPPQPRPQIVRDARSWTESNQYWSYNSITNNCEHFATLCRYGKKISLQALGMGDVFAGRVSLGEYVYQVGRSVKQACSTFWSWAKRKVTGAFYSLTGPGGLLGIEY